MRADRTPSWAKAFGGVFLALFATFPIVLVWSAARWLYVPAVVLLHVGIYLAMGLDYWAQIITVVVVFAGWDRVLTSPGWYPYAHPSRPRTTA